MNSFSDDALGFFANCYEDTHGDPNQIKRQKSACKLHVVSIDTENLIGVINDYDVTLLSCKCVDYGMRKLPCKHMYRLAHELGIIKLAGNVINDTKIKNSRQIETERTIRQAHTYKLCDEEISLIELYRSIPNDVRCKLFDYLYTLTASSTSNK